MLSQLVYTSTRKSNCSEKEIENILEACKRNNPSLSITGVLLYSDNKFIQLVEGEFKVITTLYDKIKTDPRHEDTRMISLSPIKEKSFPSWHMGAKKIVGSPVDFKTDISDEDSKIFQNLLEGKEESGVKALNLLKKFF
jgi:hypothetical protein